MIRIFYFDCCALITGILLLVLGGLLFLSSVGRQVYDQIIVSFGVAMIGAAFIFISALYWTPNVELGDT